MEPRNFKFGTQIHLGMFHLTDDKLLHRGCDGVCLYTKFDVSSFILYKLREGSQNLKIRPKIPTTPFLEYFVIHEMENTTIYPYTKFEVTSFTHSELRERVRKLKISVPTPP